MKLLKRILIGTAGAEIAETAVVLPLLFTVLLGVFFFADFAFHELNRKGGVAPS